MDLQTILSIIGAVMGSSVLTALANNFVNRKKVAADSTQIVVTTILEWATRLTVRIDALEAQLVVKDKELEALHLELLNKDMLIKDLQIKVENLEKKSN